MKAITLPAILVFVVIASIGFRNSRLKKNNLMKQKINIITIGVSDFPKMLAFYKNRLGWPTKAKATDKIAFFNLSGLVFAICDINLLKEDCDQPMSAATPPHFTLAQNLAGPDEVNKAFELIEKAGGKIIKQPQKASWGGYSGYFADPEGNLWEIAYNPYFRFDNDGNIILP
jgi:hypothetical protein